ncbi:MAG: nucleotidyl transferase AbiEii/AbiGii toxin family protein [Nanoarchaeota archaeon]|nr:nucleotidyl transferase AbiEii/AbiGii toxin family protein [Nanoarchaeota archaeon]
MIIPDKYLRETRKKKVSDEMIKKDIALSYILYEMSEDIKKDKNSPFNKLIFKGGTLLSKAHLDYHRLSEDLDFTFLENKMLNKLSKTQRQKKIKQYLKEEFLLRFESIVKKYSLDFDPSEMNKETKKYCPIKAPVHLAKFYVYLDKNDQTPIKIEINFLDELFFKPEKVKLKHLNSSSQDLVFPLGETELNSYNIEEILIEKIRAILTREGRIHERDIFDLFLLKTRGYNSLKSDLNKIKTKLRQGIGFKQDKKKEVQKIKKVEEKFNQIEREIEEEIKMMNLKDYDSQEYRRFFNELKEFLTKLDFLDL